MIVLLDSRQWIVLNSKKAISTWLTGQGLGVFLPFDFIFNYIQPSWQALSIQVIVSNLYIHGQSVWWSIQREFNGSTWPCSGCKSSGQAKGFLSAWMKPGKRCSNPERASYDWDDDGHQSTRSGREPRKLRSSTCQGLMMVPIGWSNENNWSWDDWRCLHWTWLSSHIKGVGLKTTFETLLL